jgi:phasin family protein
MEFLSIKLRNVNYWAFLCSAAKCLLTFMVRCNILASSNPNKTGFTMFDTSSFSEALKFFNPNNNPNFDMARASEAQQRTIDTVTQANKVLFEGVQNIIKAQTQFVQEQAQVAANVASKMLSAKSPEENIDTQTKFAQNAFDANVQNMQKVAKSASDISVKVFDIINKQAVTNISDFASQASAKAKKASN